MEDDVKGFRVQVYRCRLQTATNEAIQSMTNRIKDHNSYIKDPTIKYGDRWKTFDSARQQRELNHWKKEIKGFQEQIDITKDVIRSNG